MESLYRPFFLFYGGLHVVGGGVLWLAPGLTRFLLVESLSPAAGVLAGFASILGGLGFGVCALARSGATRRAVIYTAIAANAINFAAHATNVARGDSPGFVLLLAGLGTGAFLAVMLLLARAFRETASETG